MTPTITASLFLMLHLDGMDNPRHPWVYVADDTGNPVGWVYREYAVCKGETRR